MKDGHGKMGTDFWILLEKDEKFVGMTHVVSRSGYKVATLFWNLQMRFL